MHPITPRRTRTSAAACLILGASLACSSATGVDLPLLETGAPSYVLTQDGWGFEAQLDFAFTNRTGSTVYVVNCQGAFHVRLERLEGNEWVRAWGPFVPDCLSPPIEIEPGAVYEDTLTVWAAPPGSTAMPRFDLEDPAGTYRMVVVDWLSSYQDRHLPFGPQIPLEYRTSNRFELQTR